MAAPQSTGTEFSNGSLEGLPFIVTHWLANFEGGSNLESDEQRRAVERIRNASAEIASAFSSLGAFGSTIRVSIIQEEKPRSKVLRPCRHLSL